MHKKQPEDVIMNECGNSFFRRDQLFIDFADERARSFTPAVLVPYFNGEHGKQCEISPQPMDYLLFGVVDIVSVVGVWWCVIFAVLLGLVWLVSVRRWCWSWMFYSNTQIYVDATDCLLWYYWGSQPSVQRGGRIACCFEVICVVSCQILFRVTFFNSSWNFPPTFIINRAWVPGDHAICANFSYPFKLHEWTVWGPVVDKLHLTDNERNYILAVAIKIEIDGLKPNFIYRLWRRKTYEVFQYTSSGFLGNALLKIYCEGWFSINVLCVFVCVLFGVYYSAWATNMR